MSKSRLGWGVAGTLLIAVSPAWGQKSQPWDSEASITHVRGAVESRVQSCANPTPAPGWKIALDDFECHETGPINRIIWWGVVLPEGNVDQLRKKYFISIRPNVDATCDEAGAPCDAAPLTHVQTRTWCVTPGAVDVDTDCQGRTVYKFSAVLSPPFDQSTGGHYWVQVSEIETESVNPGVEDFRWSTRDPVELCQAHQYFMGGVSCAISDDCPIFLSPLDLTYKLYRLVVEGDLGGAIPPFELDEPLFFGGQLRFAGAPLDSPPLMTLQIRPDYNGKFHISPNLPDGQYQLTLIGMGTARPTRTFMLQNGGVSTVDFTGLKVGDLNNDGQINGMDIPIIVGGLLAP